MSLPVRRPEPQRRQFAVNAGALIREVAAPEGVERIGQLDTPLTEIRERIERLHLAGVCLLHVLRDRWVVGVPDGGDIDWLAIFNCGHVSPRHTEATPVLTVRCAVCDEAAAERRNAFDILAVLRHVESVHLGRSGAATAITSQSRRA